MYDAGLSKSIFSSDYLVFCELLRDFRLQKGVTQAELSKALGMAQSFVSKYEMGERRLDFVEVHRICRELELDLVGFARTYIRRVEDTASKKARARPSET